MNRTTLDKHYFAYFTADPNFVLYKSWGTDSRDLGLPRFVWVYSDGTYETRNTKYTRDINTGSPILPEESGILAE